MPGLPSGLLLASLASTESLAQEPITRGRLAAIVTILREFPLHLAQSSQHLFQHLSQLGVFRSFPRQFSLKSVALRLFCRQFLLQLCDLFLCRHAFSVAALATLPV
jgi:hypothetical protein